MATENDSLKASTDDRQSPPGRGQIVVEIALVFAVFFIQGATPVPEVNEPYYLGKAIHFWNPDWVRGDLFLDSVDTHQVFYFTFGWLALWLKPAVLAWFGRVLTWLLLAWSWRRLSFAVVPRRWSSVLTAALFVCLLQRCHMAGEWVVGGVEAKGFAYVLVFLGLESLVHGRWNRAWLLLGAAAAFHVLVGGWAVVAAGVAWLMLPSDRPPLKSIWPGLLGGFVLSLPGLIPSLGLTWGINPDTVKQSNHIYVFLRLKHHLDIARIPASFVLRFLAMTAVCAILFLVTPARAANRRLRMFLAGALILAGVGVLVRVLLGDSALSASLLRFYWFRLADVMVPVTAALLVADYVVHSPASWPRVGRTVLVLAMLVGFLHVGHRGVQRLIPAPPPADRWVDYARWRLACDWVADSGEIRSDARFLTPKMSHTFKWYAHRSEVANWKEIPQDARAIVLWWQRITDVHGTGRRLPQEKTLAELGAERLEQLGEKYDADYVLTVAAPRPELEMVYHNDAYAIYRLR